MTLIKPFATFTHTQLAYMGCLSTTLCQHCGKLYGHHYGDGQPPKCYSNEGNMREQEKEQKKVDDWNTRYKIGQEVEVTMDGYKIKTETKFEASMLCDHTAVVHLNNFTGGISLDQIRAIEQRE